ncbi:hypothetical protein PG993_011122 [Apiospora rasikravindrae]|uniref:Uncharacterized protein n=1 Tax=Apiospora rasikravindrae TaxID=990691 RepID=A0ABR1SD99_9PEZI
MSILPAGAQPPLVASPNDGVPLASPRGSYDYPRRPNNMASPPPLQHPQPQRQWGSSLPTADRYNNNTSRGLEAGFGNSPATVTTSGGGGYMSAGAGVSEFDTSLGVRLDYEAAAAYLAGPPVGAILLLILERSSDYVRFHAWQSSLMFTALFIIHLIFSWSTFLSWVLILGDLALMAFMALKAYRDADTLDRYEVPIFGQLASRILDDE